MQAPEAMHRGVLEADLDRARDVHVALAGRASGRRWPKLGNQLVGVEAPHHHVAFLGSSAAFTAAVHTEITLGESVPAIVGKLHQFAHQVGMIVLAVRGQPHDLVFLAERVEPDVLAQRGVEEAKAIGQVDFVENVDPVTLAPRRHHRNEIARCVIGESGGEGFERRTIIGRSDVGEVVLDRYGLETNFGRVFVANLGKPVEHRDRRVRAPQVG